MISRPAAWRREIVFVAAVAGALYLYAADPSLGPSLALLWAIWRFTHVQGLPPVLPLALTYQWMQVCIGNWYLVLTDRDLPAFLVSGIDQTVMQALGTVAALTLGLAIGIRLVRPEPDRSEHLGNLLSTQTLVVIYVAMLLSEGTLQRVALEYATLRQALVAVQLGRYGVLFLLVRRFTESGFRTAPLVTLIGIELALGFTGFFAAFKEPLAVIALVLLAQFNFRQFSHWAAATAVVLLSVLLATLWLGVRGTYRAALVEDESLSTRVARLERVWGLAGDWMTLERENFFGDLDTLVDRLWVQYYPALAIRRVPNALPHTDGQFFSEALRHVFMPRILFPDKPDLEPDSEKVRYYSGVWVAGAAEGTSIALGYATEMYIDFGVPAMFLPTLGYGLLLGVLFGFFRRAIFISELAVPLLTVVFWLALYLHEKSFAKMLGDSFTLIAYLGGLTLIIDRFVASGRIATTAQRTVADSLVSNGWRNQPLSAGRNLTPPR